MTATAKRAKRPVELSVRLAGYILKNKAKGRRKFPLVTMLEPLEMCNLACIGCGRIREYKPVLDKMMPVDEAINAVKESGAPSFPSPGASRPSTRASTKSSTVWWRKSTSSIAAPTACCWSG